MSAALRLGTRASALAAAQAGQVGAEITTRTGREVELVEVTTYGDTSRAALATIGGTGVFVTALREALLMGQVDLAVHSLKDLPTDPADGLVLAAVPTRLDPRDVLVSRDGLRLADLPAGSQVGTGSPRRAAQLRMAFPALDVVPVRGNVDSRIGFVTGGELDAVVLARAGLARLGRIGEVTEEIDPGLMLPAPGQGALAVECRQADSQTVLLVGTLEDPASRAAVAAERALLARLEAGCSAPVGALATLAEEGYWIPGLTLRAAVISPDGARVLRSSGAAPVDDAEGLGWRLAEELLAAGAAGLMPQGEPRAGDRSLADPTSPAAQPSVKSAKELTP